METTLTIRAGRELKSALEERALAQGKSLSRLVREILEQAVAEVPMSHRVGHLAGRLRPAKEEGSEDAWREHLRRQNWRS